MTLKVAINGYGRIGRNVLRALYENNYNDKIKVVVINAKGSLQDNIHCTKYDSVHGKFAFEVTGDAEGNLVINNDKIKLIYERSLNKIDWSQFGVDLVLECTGSFNSKVEAQVHLNSGAKKVLLSGPGMDVKTIVYGVNHDTLTSSDLIVSCASCTTNCLAPLVKAIHSKLEIVQGLMTTVHAYTNDQVLTDVYHSDLRRARAATQSIIPTKTGAAATIGLVIPELAGKLDGLALRVPTINVSLVDLSVVVKGNTSVQEVNDLLTVFSKTSLKNTLAINTEPLVSIDFNHHLASCIVDVTQTKVSGNLVKVLAWYDNEWAFANRMLDVALLMFAGKQ